MLGARTADQRAARDAAEELRRRWEPRPRPRAHHQPARERRAALPPAVAQGKAIALERRQPRVAAALEPLGPVEHQRQERVLEADGDDDGLPDIDLHEVSKPRHPKKIRIDGSSSGTNKKIVFNDDGDEDEYADILKDNTAELSSFEKEKFDNIANANDEYVEQIRRRLGQTKEQDKAEEKERVRQKHKKKRLKEKGDRDDEEDEDGGAMLVTLGGASGGEEEEVVGSSGSESSSGSEDSDSDSDNGDSGMDVKGAEDLALAMIRNSA